MGPVWPLLGFMVPPGLGDGLGGKTVLDLWVTNMPMPSCASVSLPIKEGLRVAESHLWLWGRSLENPQGVSWGSLEGQLFTGDIWLPGASAATTLIPLWPVWAPRRSSGHGPVSQANLVLKHFCDSLWLNYHVDDGDKPGLPSSSPSSATSC